jgi:cellulose biosynthesis protein BcsQ
MIGRPPYVVVVTAPSRGVGKSTLAANLAVYLKALDEDLPVAYLPFDTQAGSAGMFHLGPLPGRALTGLRQGASFTDLLTFGEFGVEYFAPMTDAARVEPPEWLRKELARVDYPGVLLIDAGTAGPQLRAAIWAADLLLVPVKDPADLPAITHLQQELRSSGGRPDQLWLLPSQLGNVLFGAQSPDWQELLRFAAAERELQVVKEQFPADPQVHAQACRLGKSVLTRLPKSELHGQLRQLGELLLEQRRRQGSFPVRLRRWLADELLPARAARIDFRCPLCRQPVTWGKAQYLEGYPGRRRLLLHAGCVALLLGGRATRAFHGEPGLLLIQTGAAYSGGAEKLVLKQFDAAPELLGSEFFQPATGEGWADLLYAAAGRLPEELYAEQFLLSGPESVAAIVRRQWYHQFNRQRRELRRLCRRENI